MNHLSYRFNLQTFLISMMISLFLISCQSNSDGGTTTGNPVTVGFAVAGNSQVTNVTNSFRSILDLKHLFDSLFLKVAQAAILPMNLQDLSGLTVTVTEAWVGIKEVEFKVEQVNDGTDEIEIRFQGPYMVNLLESSPELLATGTISQQTYKRIRTKLSRVEDLPSGAPSELQTNSLYLAGTIGPYSFSLSSNDETEFEVAGENGITPQNNRNLLVVMNLADLFRKIDLSVITSDTNINENSRFDTSNVSKCTAIDPSAHDLYTCFRNGIESESNFGQDDGDFDLDENDETVK